MSVPRRVIIGLLVALAMVALPSAALGAITFTPSAGTTSYTVGGAAVAVDPAFGVADDGQHPSAPWIDYVTIQASVGDTLAYTAGSFVCSSGMDVIRASSAASHQLTLEIVSPVNGCTAAEWQSRLRLVTFSTSTAGVARAVQFRAVKSGTTLATASKTVDASGLPQVVLPTPSRTYTEDSGQLTLAPDAVVSSSYSSTLLSATVRIVGNYASADDALSLGAHAVSGISSSFNVGTGTLTITGTGKTASEWQAVLRAVRFRNTSHNPSTATRTVRFSVQDGAGTGSADLSLAVTAVNDLPFVGTFLGTASFTEGGGPVVVNSGVQVTDPDSATLWSGTVSITGNFASGQDVVGFTNDGSTMGNISGSYNASSGVLTLTSSGGTATVAQWQAALRAVTYSNSSSSPSTATRTLDFRVHDGFGSSADGSTSTVSVVAVNNAPVVTTSGGTTAYTEASGAAAVDPALTLSDADSATLASATVQITANLSSGQDQLAFTNNGSSMGNIAVSGSYDSLTGTLNLVSAGGTATVAQWQAALRAVTYENVSLAPSTSLRTVSFTASDGTAASSAATKAVSVSAVNTAPQIVTNPGTTPFTEDGPPVAVDGALVVADADDATLASATVSITGNFAAGEDVLAFTNNGSSMGNVSGSYNAGTGVLTLTSSGATASKTQWRSALRTVTYSNTSQAPSIATRTVSFVVNDGTSNSTAATRTVSVAAVADPPMVDITGFTLSAHEQVATQVDSGIQVTDADVTGITDAQVLLSTGFVAGQDVLGFTNTGSTMGNISGSYDAASGVLSMASAGGTATVTQWRTALRAVTYLNTSNTPDVGLRAVTVRVRDGEDRPWVSDSRPLQVQAVNDAPSWLPVTVSIPMDDPWVFGSTSDLAPLYSDPEGGSLTQVKVTSVGAWGQVRDCNGQALTLPAIVIAADFLGSGPCPLRFVPVAGGLDSNRIDLEVHDGQAWSGPSSLTLETTATPPSIAVDGGAISVPAGASVAVGSGVVLGSTRAQGLPNGAVQVVSGGAPGDSLAITVPHNILSIGGNPTALDLVSASTPLATPGEWQSTMRTVTFRAGSTPGTRTIRFQVGNGLATSHASVVVQVTSPGPPAGEGAGSAPVASPAEPLAPPPPASLTPASRALAAFSAAVARAAAARARALAACARRPVAARAACRAAANRSHARAVALATAVRTRDLALAQCEAKTGAAKAACTAAARSRYARDRGRAVG